MTCPLCNKTLDTVQPTDDMIKLGFTTPKDLYACKCPTYLLDELLFVRDENIEIDKIQRHSLEILHAKFRDKKNWINRYVENIRIDIRDDYIDYGRVQYQKAANAEKENDSVGQAKNTQQVIWGILYESKRNKE